MLKFLISLSLLFLFINPGRSQSHNFLSLYQYNANIINPAYAGSHESLDVGVMRKWDYIHLFNFESIEGAPSSFIANVHSPIADKFGAGISFESNKIGPVKQKEINLDISYKVIKNEKAALLIGINGGLSTINTRLTDLSTIIDDPLFEPDHNGTQKKISGGIYYQTNEFYAGVSYSHPLTIYYSLNDITIEDVTDDNIIIGTTGYVFSLSEKIKLKPSLLVGSFSSINDIWFYLSGNLFIDEIIELGIQSDFSKDFSLAINSPEIAKLFKIGVNINVLEKNSLNYSYQNITLFTNFNIDAFKKKQGPNYF